VFVVVSAAGLFVSVAVTAAWAYVIKYGLEADGVVDCGGVIAIVEQCVWVCVVHCVTSCFCRWCVYVGRNHCDSGGQNKNWIVAADGVVVCGGMYVRLLSTFVSVRECGCCFVFVFVSAAGMFMPVQA
jgi:hypothetical protein